MRDLLIGRTIVEVIEDLPYQGDVVLRLDDGGLVKLEGTGYEVDGVAASVITEGEIRRRRHDRAVALKRARYLNPLRPPNTLIGITKAINHDMAGARLDWQRAVGRQFYFGPEDK